MLLEILLGISDLGVLCKVNFTVLVTCGISLLTVLMAGVHARLKFLVCMSLVFFCFFFNMSVVWDGLYTEMFLLVCTNKASSCRNKIMILHDELMY